MYFSQTTEKLIIYRHGIQIQDHCNLRDLMELLLQVFKGVDERDGIIQTLKKVAKLPPMLYIGIDYHYFRFFPTQSPTPNREFANEDRQVPCPRLSLWHKAGIDGIKRVKSLRRDGYFKGGYFPAISDTFKTQERYIKNINWLRVSENHTQSEGFGHENTLHVAPLFLYRVAIKK